MNVSFNASFPSSPSICAKSGELGKKGYVKLEQTREKNKLEYERLLDIAQEKHIDISKHTNQLMEDIEKQTKEEVKVLSPSKVTRLRYETQVYEKCNLEIGRLISKHSLFQQENPYVFNLFKPSTKPLKDKLEDRRLEYQKIISVANEKGIDVSHYTNKMKQVLAELPASDDQHQFESIRMLYEIKMYEKYNPVISRKLAQEGLFRTSQQTQAELKWQLRTVRMSFQEWARKADEKDVDVTEYIDKMEEFFMSQPDINDQHQCTSVAMLSLIKMGKIYCIEIIREIAKSEINRLAELARQTPELEDQIAMINRNEQFLLKMLPVAKGREIHISQAEAQYRQIQDKMEEMTQKIMGKTRKS